MFEGVTTFSLLLVLIILLVLVILLTLFAILIYSGLFQGVEDIGTGKPPVGQLIIAYKFQRGPYHEAGQLFTEAAIIAPKNKALGIYYDDPKKVDSNYLRYAVGSIISEGDAPVDETMVKDFTEKGFKILHLPEVTFAVRTSFPHVTTLSILIAVRKAYPMIESYIEEYKLCAHPYMEYYDGDTIHFFAPLSKQDEFYVPECNSGGAGDARGDVVETMDQWESSSNLSASQTFDEESHASLNLTQTTVDSQSSRDLGEEEEDEQESTPMRDSDAPSEEEKDKRDVDEDGDSVDHGSDDTGVTKKEDEDVSDDSTSSFEVVKKEKDV